MNLRYPVMSTRVFELPAVPAALWLPGQLYVGRLPLTFVAIRQSPLVQRVKIE